MSDTPMNNTDLQTNGELSEVQKLLGISKRIDEINDRLRVLHNEQYSRSLRRDIYEIDLLSPEKIKEWSESYAKDATETADEDYARRRLMPLSIGFIILYIISLALPTFVVLPYASETSDSYPLFCLFFYVIGLIAIIYLNKKPA